MRIRVTQKDINNGARRNSSSCPVALALNRKGFINVDVIPSSITFMNDEYGYYTTSIKLDNWIRSFDQNEPVKPTSFEFPYTPNP